MKKFRYLSVILASLIAIAGAFATQKRSSCEFQQQYFKSGDTYLPAGEYGVDYDCFNSSGICTYYRPDPTKEIYAPCHTGTYIPVDKAER